MSASKARIHAVIPLLLASGILILADAGKTTKKLPQAPSYAVSDVRENMEKPCSLCCCMIKFRDCARDCKRLQASQILAAESRAVEQKTPKPALGATMYIAKLFEMLTARLRQISQLEDISNNMCRSLCFYKESTGKDVYPAKEVPHHH